MRPFSVFGPSTGKCVPSRRFKVRSGARPSTTTGAVGAAPVGVRPVGRLRREIADDLLDDVLDRHEATSSPYSSTTRPSRSRSFWNCCSCARSGVPGGNEIRRAQDRAQPIRIDLAVALEVHDLLQVNHADDVVERVLVSRQPRVVRRGELLREA
jgi:hypothetical protein